MKLKTLILQALLWVGAVSAATIWVGSVSAAIPEVTLMVRTNGELARPTNFFGGNTGLLMRAIAPHIPAGGGGGDLSVTNAIIAMLYPALIIKPTDNLSAVAATNHNRLLIATNGHYIINTNLTFTNTVAIKFMWGAVWSLSNTARVNIRGPIEAYDNQHIFSNYVLGVSFSNANHRQTIFFDWFGANGMHGLNGITAPDCSTAVNAAVAAATTAVAEAQVSDGGLTAAFNAHVSAYYPRMRPLAFGGGRYIVSSNLLFRARYFLSIEGNGSKLIGHNLGTTNGIMTLQDCFRPHIRNLEFLSEVSDPVKWHIKTMNITPVGSDPNVLPSEGVFEKLVGSGNNGGMKYGLWIASASPGQNQEFYVIRDCRFANYSRAAILVAESQAFATRIENTTWNDDQRIAPFGVTCFDPEDEPNGNGNFSIHGGGGGYSTAVDILAASTAPTLVEGVNSEGANRFFWGGQWFPCTTNQFSYATNSLKGTNALIYCFARGNTSPITLGYTNFDYTANSRTFEYVDLATNLIRVVVALGTLPYDPSINNGTLVGIIETSASGITNFIQTKGSGNSATAGPGAVTLINNRLSTQYPTWDGVLVGMTWAGQLNFSWNRVRIMGANNQLFKIALHTGTSNQHGASASIVGNMIMEVNTNALATATNMFDRLFLTGGDGSKETNNQGRAGLVTYRTEGNRYTWTTPETAIPMSEAWNYIGDMDLNKGAMRAFASGGVQLGRSGLGITNLAALYLRNGEDGSIRFRNGADSAYLNAIWLSGGNILGVGRGNVTGIEIQPGSGSDLQLLTAGGGAIGSSVGTLFGVGTLSPTNRLDVVGGTSLREKVWMHAPSTNSAVASILGRLASGEVVETTQPSNAVKVAASGAGVAVTASGSGGVMTYTVSGTFAIYSNGVFIANATNLNLVGFTLITNANGSVSMGNSATGGGTPVGDSGALQFTYAGALWGTNELRFDPTNRVFRVPANMYLTNTAAGVVFRMDTAAGDFTSAQQWSHAGNGGSFSVLVSSNNWRLVADIGSSGPFFIDADRIRRSLSFGGAGGLLNVITNWAVVYFPSGAVFSGSVSFDAMSIGILSVVSNRLAFADAANHQIDLALYTDFEGTNSMAQGTRFAITNSYTTNFAAVRIDIEGAASGGSNYAITNTFPTGDLASLNGGALATSFTDTCTNGTAFEDSWQKTWKRGTNIWVGYRLWRTR